MHKIAVLSGVAALVALIVLPASLAASQRASKNREGQFAVIDLSPADGRSGSAKH